MGVFLGGERYSIGMNFGKINNRTISTGPDHDRAEVKVVDISESGPATPGYIPIAVVKELGKGPPTPVKSMHEDSEQVGVDLAVGNDFTVKRMENGDFVVDASMVFPTREDQAKLRRVAEDYDATVEFDNPNCELNTAACGGKDIYMGKFEKRSWAIAAFFHELGHSYKLFPHHGDWVCHISGEAIAWELGFMLAQKYEFLISKSEWDEAHHYAARQLETYKVSHAGADRELNWKYIPNPD
jgi:hypothetical protein